GINVYLGHDEIIGAERIIKEIQKSKKNQPNDYNTLKKLKHPGIPEIMDAFEENGSFYIVMQYVEGRNLKEAVEIDGCRDESEAMGITLDILEAVDYLQSIKPEPVIHGDIKPENIILSKDRAVLIDFGSAGNDTGSSGFCAPERLAGIRKSLSSDIYSCGEILHYLITGKVKKVFGKEKAIQMDAGLFRVIEKSTGRAPSERYARASEMASELRRLQELRKTGMPAGAGIRSICFYGNSEMACEAGLVAGKHGKKVLVADLDMLSPRIDLICGIRKYEYSLQDFMGGLPSDLKSKCTKVNKNLFLLPCRNDFENYETAGAGMVAKIMGACAGTFDAVMFACCGFPYDSYLADAIFLSDKIIFPIEKGAPDIRKYNSIVRFMTGRQNLPADKMNYVGYNYTKGILDGGVASGASEAAWLGSVPFCRNRAGMYSEGKSYVKSFDKKNFREYSKILKKLGVV
ncbi:MAG: protein kinase, partial [Clostridia bacterium]|nr:protein kinase [Clostridia bacterium]